jgi:hypothetical protein
LEAQAVNLRKYEALLMVASIIGLVGLCASCVPAINLSVYAQQPPSRPMLVSGTVTLNGSPAPDGLTVIAKVGGQVRGTATVSGGQYELVANGTNGETVDFYLNNLQSDQHLTFDNVSNGGLETLNLAFTGNVITATTATTTSSSTTEIAEFPNAALLVLGITVLATILLARPKQAKNR